MKTHSAARRVSLFYITADGFWFFIKLEILRRRAGEKIDSFNCFRVCLKVVRAFVCTCNLPACLCAFYRDEYNGKLRARADSRPSWILVI